MEYDYVSEKKCTVCAITKPREEYHRSRNRNDGLFGACKECVYEYTNKWRQDNKGYYSIRAKLRKQQMDRAMPHWLTNEQHQQIQAIYDHARECSSLTGDAYVVDHIVPIKGKNVCGLHVPWNLQVLPSDVNDSKGNRMPPKDQHVAPVCELRR
jgi:5-methylcytosine-specific restriction endonuclease McrA